MWYLPWGVLIPNNIMSIAHEEKRFTS
jgi:hypothetical protein